MLTPLSLILTITTLIPKIYNINTNILSSYIVYDITRVLTRKLYNITTQEMDMKIHEYKNQDMKISSL